MKTTSILQFLASWVVCVSSTDTLGWQQLDIVRTRSAGTVELLGLHKHLIEIQSITPNESYVGNYLVKYLRSQNLTVSTQSVGEQNVADSTIHERFNIHAYIGSTPNTRTLVSSHIDTVPPFWPYEVRNDGTEIWGRGSVDAKGSVAAQIAAFLKLRDAGKIKEGDAGLLFVVGEETDGLGMRTVNDLNMTWKSVIFGEPTEGKLVCGHKGIQGFHVKAHGKAVHSGYPWLGVSANSMLITALARLEAHNGSFPSSKKYGDTTLNIGRIQGGVAANVVAESAEAQCAMRLAAGSPADARNTVLEIVRNVSTEFENQGGSLEVLFSGNGYSPVNIDCDIEGFETMTVNYGTDIPNLKGDHKRYLYGPGSILVAHSDHEHLKIKELEQAVKDYEKIILFTLKKNSADINESGVPEEL